MPKYVETQKMSGKRKKNPPTAVLRKQVETKMAWNRKLPKPNLLLLCLKTAAMDADGMAPDSRWL